MMREPGALGALSAPLEVQVNAISVVAAFHVKEAYVTDTATISIALTSKLPHRLQFSKLSLGFNDSAYDVTITDVATVRVLVT